MSAEILRHKIAILLISVHSILLLLLIILSIFGWFDDDELKVSIPIVIPTFASFVTIVYEFVTLNAVVNVSTAQGTEQYSKTFVFLSYITPVLFTISLLAVIIGQVITHTAIGQYSILLGLVETGFAVYIGFVVKVLFKKQ